MWRNRRISMRLKRRKPNTERCCWKLKKCPEVRGLFLIYTFYKTPLKMECDVKLNECARHFNYFHLLSTSSWLRHFHKQYATEIPNYSDSNWNHFLKYFPQNIFLQSCDDVCESRSHSRDYVSCRWSEYDRFGRICVLQHRSVFGVRYNTSLNWLAFEMLIQKINPEMKWITFLAI